MIQTPPEVSPNGRYNITQAAKALNVSRNTLRKYAREGWLRVTMRPGDNRLLIPGSAILKFWNKTL